MVICFKSFIREFRSPHWILDGAGPNTGSKRLGAHRYGYSDTGVLNPFRDFDLSAATVQHPLEPPRARACALAGVARLSAQSPPPTGCHADARHDSAQSARLLRLADTGATRHNGLVGDRIPMAELGHCAFAELVLKYKSRPFANAKRKALAGTETVKSATRATRCRFDDASRNSMVPKAATLG
jgi:hypothetical protein